MKEIMERPHEKLQAVGIINATDIALAELGANIPSTCILGALAAVTGWLQVDSLLKSLEDYFKGATLAKNRRCVERGFHELKVLQLKR